ncbi:hypothetical protein PROFUN_05008 [Planoprotostelium fungivorum]|uniref:E2 ubiquitin-conjugating enzyme n=1 Tax=Planoprotostelium fungivorum TaxID=1890364 RepID=A0A2P6NS62_9EUKA|nr:hypothetical protein PROFUN_05008 [Planoprotostelium fungivorum]
MAGTAYKRLMQEYIELTKNPPEGILAGPISEDNFFEWEASIIGPSGTAYEGGLFIAILKFPTDYPLSPPKMIFTTEMWHPNVYPNGEVCISILHPPGDDPMHYENASERWSPVQSVEKILLSVVSMIAEPNDESPANIEAAKMWRTDKKQYENIVKRTATGYQYTEADNSCYTLRSPCVGSIATARHDYQAKGIRMSTGITDVDMKKGDVVIIQELCPNSWVSIVFVTDEKNLNPIPDRSPGVVPMSFLDSELSDDSYTLLSSLHSTVHDLATAIWDYQATGQQMSSGDTDISLSRGDVVRVLDSCPNSWLKVQKVTNAEIGVVPESYVQRFDTASWSSSADVSASSYSEDEIYRSGDYIRKQRSDSSSSTGRRSRSASIPNSLVNRSQVEDFGRPASIIVERKMEELMTKIPHSHVFSSPDTPDNIIYDVIKVVERLTYPKFIDPFFADQFLITYRNFCTPEVFLDFLIESETGTIEVNQMRRTRVRECRVFNVLKRWLEDYWWDFRDEQEMQSRLLTFAEKTMKLSMETAANTIIKIVHRKLEPFVLELPMFPQTNYINRLLSIPPETIAEQMTLIDHGLFRMMEMKEFHGLPWSKKTKQHRAPNVMNVIRRFNRVSLNMVGSTIVHEQDIELRAMLVCHFIQVVEHLEELNSYNALLAIVLGLRTGFIGRLRTTWSKLDEEHQRKFQRLVDTYSPEGSHLNLRQILRRRDISRPCIPYLGIYLSDLTIIEEIHPDRIGDLINFEKCGKVASVLKDILLFQKTPYSHLTRDKMVHALLHGEKEEEPDEDECYKASLLVEPPTPKEPRRETLPSVQPPISPQKPRKKSFFSLTGFLQPKFYDRKRASGIEESEGRERKGTKGIYQVNSAEELKKTEARPIPRPLTSVISPSSDDHRSPSKSWHVARSPAEAVDLSNFHIGNYRRGFGSPPAKLSFGYRMLQRFCPVSGTQHFPEPTTSIFLNIQSLRTQDIIMAIVWEIIKFDGSSLELSAETVKQMVNILKDRIEREGDRPGSPAPKNRGDGLPYIVIVSAFKQAHKQLLSIADSAISGSESHEDQFKSYCQRHHTVVESLFPEGKRERIMERVEMILSQLKDLFQGLHWVGAHTPQTLYEISSKADQIAGILLTEALLYNEREAYVINAREFLVNQDTAAHKTVDVSKSSNKARKYFSTLNNQRGIPVVVSSDELVDVEKAAEYGAHGSDFTASLLGVALGVSRIQIFTNLPGVFSADPLKVPEAILIPSMSYEEAREFSYFGANFVQPSALAVASKSQIPIQIRSLINPTARGMLIEPMPEVHEDWPIRGLSSIDNIGLLKMEGTSLDHTASQRFFKAISNSSHQPKLSVQGSSDRSVLVALDDSAISDCSQCLEREFELERLKKQVSNPIVIKNLSIVVIIGDHLATKPQNIGKLFSSMVPGTRFYAVCYGHGGRSIALLVDSSSALDCVKSVHSAFFGSKLTSSAIHN